jgi:hypothetical protein
VSRLLGERLLGENAPQPAWVEYLAVAPTPHAANDEFNDNTVDPAWVVVEDTSPNIVVSEGLDMLSVRHPGGDSAEEWHGVVRPFAPAGDFMLETCIRIGGVSQNHQAFGLVAADGATYGAGGQMIASWTISNATFALESFQNWNGRLTRQFFNFRLDSPFVFLRLSRVGTAWTASASPDGVSWIATASISRSLTISHIGLACTTWGGSSAQVYSAEYFRVTE